MSKRRKQSWKTGDCFLVPLTDGSFSIGQIIGQEKEVLNSVICIFFDSKTTSHDGAKGQVSNLSEDNVISALFTTRDLLDSGDWKVFGNSDLISADKFFNLNDLRGKEFVGVKIIGSGIVIKFLDAFYGLYPWNGFHNPDYLDGLLISQEKKPAKIILQD
jgi:hypothetical protein